MSDSMDKLRQEILTDVDIKKSRILDEARAEAEKIIQNAVEETTLIAQDREAKVFAQMEVETRNLLARTRVQGRIKIQQAKYDAVKNIFREVIDEVAGKIQGGDYSILEKNIISLGKNIEGSLIIKCAVNMDPDKFNLKQISSQLGNRNVKAEKGDFYELGAILSNENQEIFYDLKLESIAAYIQEKNLSKVADILFKD